MSKIFKRKVWTWTFFGFGTIFALTAAGIQVARDNAAALNNALGISTSRRSGGDGAEYFKRDYANKPNELKDYFKQVAEEVEAEGLVLLENRNNALPLAAGKRNVSLVGTAAYRFNYNTSGSSATDSGGYPSLSQVLGEKNFTVNPTLKAFYETGAGKDYGRNLRSGEYRVDEAGYDKLGANEVASIDQYKDAAIVVFARDSGEGRDLSTEGSDGKDGYYLNLTAEEESILSGLTALKQAGKLDKIIVLLNSSNPISVDFMFDARFNVDALAWVGNVGAYGIRSVAGMLAGDVNPSGRLSDTFARDLLSSPAMKSWSLNDYKSFSQVYTNYSGKDKSFNTTNRMYGVYNEGIYVGYRYYETRYTDVVAGRANAGNFDYDAVVGYPFGFGKSFNAYSYSDFALTPANDGKTFKVSVTVKNDSATISGKHAVQVYLQKPYTDYDIQNGVEVSAVELVGFGKTKVLEPGATEKVEITVEKERFKSYDANGAKTYILDAGDYRLTVASDAHAAANNFLKKDGKNVQGNAAMVGTWNNPTFDKVTFSKSYQTGEAITNQLDHADPNRYAHSGTNHVTYVSRNDWKGTYPSIPNALKIATEEMKADNQSHKALPISNDIMPKYGQESTIKSAVDLRSFEGAEIKFDDPRWEEFMDSMTYGDQSLLITNGNMTTSTLESINLPATAAADGPTAVTKTRTDSSFPSEGIWASTFNKELVRKVGDALAEDCLSGINAGQDYPVTALYAPGVNIHRAPYIGRSNEYFSEDPVLSGEMAVYEIQGLQAKGVIAHTKHLAFNDEESDRNGIAIWLNEQAAREIYLLPFEYAVSEDKGYSHAVMSSFNRVGTIWAGADAGLQLNILQKEWGFHGYVITDMAQSNAALYMVHDDGFVNGTNLFMASGSATALDAYKDNAYFALKVRDSAKRIIYNIVNFSASMNGISSNTKVESVTPWWDTLLTTLVITSGILAAGALALSIVSRVKGRKEQ